MAQSPFCVAELLQQFSPFIQLVDLSTRKYSKRVVERSVTEQA